MRLCSLLLFIFDLAHSLTQLYNYCCCFSYIVFFFLQKNVRMICCAFCGLQLLLSYLHVKSYVALFSCCCCCCCFSTHIMRLLCSLLLHCVFATNCTIVLPYIYVCVCMCVDGCTHPYICICLTISMMAN